MGSERESDLLRPLSCDQVVRDLLWVVNSPSLLGDFIQHGDAPHYSSLSASQIDGDRLLREVLNSFAAKRNLRRVGHYFECLIRYWLTEIRGLELMVHGEPIRQDGRTLGEIDFIFRDEQARLTHWEVAVKFYLFNAMDSVDASHLIGPNTRDTFERKVTRLFTHQLELGRNHFPNVQQHAAFLKGQICYPLTQSETPVPIGNLPSELASDHGKSLYLASNQLPSLHDLGDAELAIMRKPFWLSSHVKQADAMDIDQVIAVMTHHFERSTSPVLLSCRSTKPQNELPWDRVFVVHSSWPDVTRQSPQSD